jgi:TRAP-type C4-dicarboxylate transport system substrate-binding protein
VLRGYGDFHIVGAFCTEPFTLHAAKKLTCLTDLNGMKLRAANSADEIMLKQLGADARIVPGDRIVSAIESGEIDGTTLHIGPLYDLGVDRVTRYDYLLRLGCAPLLVLMNKRSLDRLPAPAQEAIRRQSGEAYARNYTRRVAAHSRRIAGQAQSRSAAHPHRAAASRDRSVERCVQTDCRWVAGEGFAQCAYP